MWLQRAEAETQGSRHLRTVRLTGKSSQEIFTERPLFISTVPMKGSRVLQDEAPNTSHLRCLRAPVEWEGEAPSTYSQASVQKVLPRVYLLHAEDTARAAVRTCPCTARMGKNI